jgi:signal transduction histidine kinase
MVEDPPHRSPPPPVPLSQDEQAALVRRLAALPELSEVPASQLEWLVGRGQFFRLPDAYRVHAIDDWVGLVLLISGRFSVRVSQNGTEREVREITPGRVTGYLPFSRMTSPRGYLVADGDVEVLVVRREDFPAVVSACYEFTEVCVQEMLARVRVFKAEDKHQEKMAALGRLAAGLAHELNNPASAVLRCARELDESRRRIVEAASGLGSFGLDPESPVCHGLEAARLREGRPSSPVARAMREEALAEWLASRGLDDTLADALSEAGVEVPDLDAASANLEPGAVSAVL